MPEILRCALSEMIRYRLLEPIKVPFESKELHDSTKI